MNVNIRESLITLALGVLSACAGISVVCGTVLLVRFVLRG